VSVRLLVPDCLVAQNIWTVCFFFFLNSFHNMHLGQGLCYSSKNVYYGRGRTEEALTGIVFVVGCCSM